MPARSRKPKAARITAATAPAPGLLWQYILRSIASKGEVPRTEEWRPFFGKALTPTRIENALTNADHGYLQDLTDIGQEQLCYDPHLCSLLGKRNGRIGAAPWDFTPAQGTGVDKKFAMLAADLLRSQFAAIPSISQAFEDLAWAHWDGRGAIENHFERIAFGWRIAEFGWVAPRRLSLGRRRELRLVDTVGGVGLEPEGAPIEDLWGKFVTLKPRLFNEYPEREGLLRRAIFWSFHKRFAARERAIIIELLRHGRQLLKESETNTTQFDDDALAKHADRLDGMNTGSTAYLPKGLEFDTHEIDSAATEGHDRMIDSVDRQLSKLVLGGIGTTDEVRGGGIGAKTSETHDAQQQFIFDRDGVRIAERFQLCAARPLMVLNKHRLGIASDDDALALTPLFSLRTQKPEDRDAILTQAKSFLDLGAALPLDELRQRTGWRKPDKDEAILQLTDSPQLEGSARFIEPRVRVIDPSGTEPGQDTPKAPAPVNPAPTAPTGDGAPSAPTETLDAPATAAGEPAEIDLTDDEEWGIHSASVLGIQRELDELRDTFALADDSASNFPTIGANLRPSLRNSRYRVFPQPEAEALRTEYPEVWRKASSPLASLQYRRLSPVARRGGVVTTDQEEESVRLREAWASKHVADSDIAGVIAQVKWLVVGEMGLDRMRRVIADAKARVSATAPADVVIAARQPSTPNGSPESIIARSKRAGLPVLSAWAHAFESGARGETAPEIRASLRRVARSLNPDALASCIEETLLHGAMLGAMDADLEAREDIALKPIAFDASEEPLLLVAGFATKPFAEAIASFLSKSILPKSLFERLQDSAKRKAFTIAGLALREMLQTGFDAVATSIREGRDLRNFKKDLAARFDSNGWTRLSGPHVEVIFRNATMGAYASGRDKQMSQPVVLKARPYWQILGVDDARTRDPHREAHGKVLRADDPFWKRCALPWGHACRCRKVSRSEADLKRLGLTVVDGSSISGLPDPGWSSSLSLL